MNHSLPLDELYKKMLMIRYFEQEVLKLFEQGQLFGTTHAYIGQEANAVGVIIVVMAIILRISRIHTPFSVK